MKTFANPTRYSSVYFDGFDRVIVLSRTLEYLGDDSLKANVTNYVYITGLRKIH